MLLKKAFLPLLFYQELIQCGIWLYQFLIIAYQKAFLPLLFYLLSLFISKSASTIHLYFINLIGLFTKIITSDHFGLSLLFSKHYSHPFLFIFFLLPSFPLHPLHIFIFRHRELFTQKVARYHIFNCYSFVKHNYLHLHCLLHLFIFFTSSTFYIIKQLLTIGTLHMMWCRPENTNIDRGEKHWTWCDVDQRIPILTEAKVFSGRHHIMSSAPAVNNSTHKQLLYVWKLSGY